MWAACVHSVARSDKGDSVIVGIFILPLSTRGTWNVVQKQTVLGGSAPKKQGNGPGEGGNTS